MGRWKISSREILIAAGGFVIGLILLLWWLSPRVLLPEATEFTVSPYGPIVINFTRPLDLESVGDRFSIRPTVDGQALVGEAQISFLPDEPFAYNQRYTVILEPGLRGRNGLPSLTRTAFTLTVRQPRLLFLREIDGVSNIWQRLPSGELQQLTFETVSVWDFHVAPGGLGILYTSISKDGSTKIMQLKPGAGTEPLLDCPDARCFSGRWQPGGSLVAFERNPLSGGKKPVVEVWLLDTVSGQVRPVIDPRLAAEVSSAGIYPRWSSDGRYLAFYQPDGRVVVIMDISDGSTSLVPANLEIMSGWSPDGNLLAYTELTFGDEESQGDNNSTQTGTVIDDESLFSHITIVDLASEVALDISAGQQVDYGKAVWHPGGEFLAAPRGPKGGPNQIWTISKNGQEVQRLTDDLLMNHTAVAWAHDGTRLAYMALQVGATDDLPDIWILDVENGEKVLAAEDAYLPIWLP